MTTATLDFRAQCAELLAAIQLYTGLNPAASEMSSVEKTEKLMHAMAATTAALATPPPEPPTDEELLKLTENVSTKHMYAHKSLPSNWDFGDYSSSPKGLIDFARAVLERWGK